MQYTNYKIKQLISERDASVERYNREIQKEIEKEKAKYVFKWGRLILMIVTFIWFYTAFYLNSLLFEKHSIWSWQFWFNN